MNFELDLLNTTEEEVSEVIKLLNRLLKLMPDKDKIMSLHEIITYLNSIINGDSIAQFSTYTYSTKYAKLALGELIEYVQEHTLESFKEEKEDLIDELEELQQKKDDITTEINDLEQKQNKINTNLKNLENEYAEKKKILEKEFKDLNTRVNNLCAELDIYNQKITNLDEPTPVVAWININEDHPIYNTNYKTIDDYIKSLKLIYCENMCCRIEQAEREFKKNCPELEQFAELLKEFTNPKVPEVLAVRTIFLHQHWNDEAIAKCKVLKTYLKNMKMPKYYNVEKKSFSQQFIPTNIEGNEVDLTQLKRELYFQKLILEAYSAKKIAEYNLQSAINILSQYMPRNIDLNALLNQSGINLPTIDILNEKPLTKKKEV